MSDAFIKSEASEDFNRARSKEGLSRILNLLKPQNQDLLSFEEVKSMLQPRSQSYRGMQVVPLHLIVGSEGRYRDFSKQFLPRKDHLRNRWTRVDEARLRDIILPPIQLYELGGVYFVRDGNHRVSVAKSQGVYSIDAEVISLDSEIRIDPNMSKEVLSQAVLDYEHKLFMDKTHLNDYFPDSGIRLTSPGQYDEILSHIYVHKYFINQDYEEELPFSDAVKSWYRSVYQPIQAIVREENMVARFPGRTEGDLYVWIVKHWHYIKEKYGEDISAKDAAVSYSRLYGKGFWTQFRDGFAKLLTPKKKN